MRGLRGRLESTQRRQRVQQNRLDQLQQQHSELQAQLRHQQAQIAELESEAASAQEKIDKLRERANNVTSNKEYSALLVEVNNLKEAKSKLDDATLERMEQVEQLREQAGEVAEQVEQQKRIVELAGGEVETARQQVGEQLEAATKERDEAAAKLPPEALATFERLNESHDGEGLVEVIEQDRKRMEYICGGCYMSLPFERINALMSRPDELVTCSNCGRLLYLDQELRSAIGSK